MIPDRSSDDPLNDPDFQSLLVELLERLERGEDLLHERLLDKHPQFAAPLRRFFEDQAMLRQVASAIRDSDLQHSQESPAAKYSIDATIDSGPGSTAVSPGDRIMYIGQYEILEEIARGGMGVVFKARHQKLNRIVALKMILSGFLAAKADVERFLREARAAGQLKHPNIVPVHEIGEHKGQHYFTMDYVDGHSLAAEIREESLPPRRAAELVKTVAEAVHFAHERGTLHRDLKPPNILIDGAGQPHVTDFGLAKVISRDETTEELTASGQILGTPSYMSPEQAAGKHSRIGPATDVYALGAILYACLTGRAPFVADSALDTMGQVIRNEPATPRSLNTKIPKDLETICLQCLVKEPNRRYASAALLADDLGRYLAGRAVSARPIGPAAKAWRWCRRNPAIASLLSLLILSLAVGLGFSSYFAYTAAERAVAEAEQRGRAESAAARSAELQQRAEDLAKQAVARQILAEKRVYALRIGEAVRNWETNRIRSAWTSLDQCRWDLRGWEHDFLHTRLTQGITLRGHDRAVQFVSFVDDGEHVLSLSQDSSLRKWDIATGTQIANSETGVSRISSAAISTDEQFVVVASSSPYRGGFTTWNFETEQPARKVEEGRKLRIEDIALHPDGRVMAVAVSHDGPAVQLRDTFSGQVKHVYSGKETDAHAVSFNPAGDQLAGAFQDGTVRVWATETEKQAVTFDEVLSFQAVEDSIHSIAFDHSGQRLITADDQGLIKTWNAVSGERLLTMFGHTGAVHALAIAPQDDRIASGGEDGTVRIWDVETGRQVMIHRSHMGPVMCVAFNAKGTRVASGSEDGIVKIWKDGRHSSTVTSTDETIRCVAVSRDGNRLAINGKDGTIDVWDPGRRRRLLRASGDSRLVRGLAFSPDGSQLACCGGVPGEGGEVKVWHIPSGDLRLTLKGHKVPVYAVKFSRNGHRIVSGGGEVMPRSGADQALPGEVKVWDADNGAELLTIDTLDRWVNSVDISPDGSKIAIASNDIHVWDSKTGTRLFAVQHRVRSNAESASSSVAFSGDGRRILSGSHNGSLQIWDANDGREIQSIKGHQRPVTSVVWTPDDERCFSGSYDGTVKVWDTETGTLLLSIPAHPDRIRCLAMPENGEQLYVGGEQPELRVLNASSPQRFAAIDTYADQVAFTRDRNHLATYGDDTHVTVWDVRTGEQTHQLAPPFAFGRVSGAALDAAGEVLAYSGGSWKGPNEIYLWNLDGETQGSVFAETETPIHAIVFSRDSRLLASACEDGSVLIWKLDGDRRTQLMASDASPATCIEFSQSGGWLAAGHVAGLVRIWDLASERTKLSLANEDKVTCIAVSPDDLHVAAGYDDGQIRIWDVLSGEPILQEDAHKGRINDVEFSPDGRRIATASEDRSVRVWDVDDAESVAILEGHHGQVLGVAFGLRGNTLHSVAVDARQELQTGIMRGFTTRCEYRRWLLPAGVH